MRVHRRCESTSRAAYLALAAVGLAAVAAHPAAAQGSFGRTAGAGDWADAFWVNSSGVIGGIPPSGASVFIGAAGFPHASSLASASVNVTNAQTAANLTLGQQAGDAGTLTIQPGGSLAITNTLAAGGPGSSATVTLNGQSLSVGTYAQGGPVTINRGAGGGILGNSYSISSGSFNIQTGDSFTSSGNVSGGATVSNSVAVNLSSSLAVSGSGTNYTAGAPLILGGGAAVYAGGTFTANAPVTTVSSFHLGLVNGNGAGTLHVNAGPFAAGALTVQNSGSVANLSANTTIAGGVSVFSGAALNLTAGTLTAGSLNVSGSLVNASSDIVVSNSLSLTSNAELNVTQSLGDRTGLSLEGNDLSIDATSTLNLMFDAQRAPRTLDWAFRWQGNHVAELQTLLGTRIVVSGAPYPVSVIYNTFQFGDYTYIGFVPSLADLNGDGNVDLADYLALRTNLFTNVSTLTVEQAYALGDVTADLRIDGRDFAEFRTAYDVANGVGTFVAMLRSVPEPTSMGLVAAPLAAVFIVGRCNAGRRRRIA